MCGRYVIARATGELVPLLEAEPGQTYQERISWNIGITSSVPILLERLDDDAEVHRELHTARWGLLPVWAKDRTFSNRAFNARSETVTQKPTFRSAVRARRCAVLADAYYEWTGPKGAKQPYAVRPADHGLITFAGLYEWWKDPAAEQWVLSCTILTGASPQTGAGGSLDELAQLHDRIPLAMHPETQQDWLSPGKLTADEAEAMVERIRTESFDVAAGWEVYPVDRAVGSVRNEGPQLMEPITTPGTSASLPEL